MSTQQAGNDPKNLVARQLEEFGYYCYPSDLHGLNLIALATEEMRLPHLGIEVGGASRSVRTAFEKLSTARRFPGMVFLVVRTTRKRNGHVGLRWHATYGKWGHDSLQDALAEELP